jgi:hypothetical protein
MIFFSKANKQNEIDPSLDNFDIDSKDEIENVLFQPGKIYFIILDIINLSIEDKQFKNSFKKIEQEEKDKFKEENSYPSKNYILKTNFQIKNTEENTLK